ncbi:peptidase C14 [Gymnopus androsaceus JB14]|uniref:Peptidase C14 n=1 Tax=Gymnopus androsaceus JB14 TaxID=1447944 RepID=A0A6A4IGD2_9AGAR|nr:peptidase C14 [Gymnopus androsaceus JB14]
MHFHLGHSKEVPVEAEKPFLTVEKTYETKVTTRTEWVSSNCTGNKKALLIGINYRGTNNPLDGCHSDASRMYKFITKTYGFKAENVVLLMDDHRLKPEYQPTRANILHWTHWLVKDAQAHDSLFFHYSGHGGRRPDQDGDKMDYYDDCIYPLDSVPLTHASHEQINACYQSIILDDELHQHLVSPLPAGARLTAIFDSCHSGSVLVLPFVYAAKSGKLKGGNLLAEEDAEEAHITRKARGFVALEETEVWKVREKFFEVKDMLEATKDILHETGGKLFVERDGKGALMDIERLDGLKAHVKQVEAMKKRNESLADVVLISGCKDTQSSADATENGMSTGALSWGLLTTLQENPEPTYLELLDGIRAKLKKEHYAQSPQLSTGHPMDLNVVFMA